MLNVLIVFLMAAAIIAAGHWFPWRLMLGRPLHPLEAYTYGVIAIMLPAVGALWAIGETYAALIVLAGACGAGLTTLAAYGADKIIALRHELMDAKDKAAYGSGLPIDSSD